MRQLTFISLLLLLANASFAQRRQPASQSTPRPNATRTDTTIKGTTLEVYQVYQPELKPMVKPDVSPVLPPALKEPVAQQYDVPQQTLFYSYRALPLKPLALGKDSVTLPYQNYALLAGGNFSTILTELGIGSLKGRNWNSALFSRYITQEGKLENQVYRSFLLKGAADYRAEQHMYEAGLDVYRDVFGRYGYNHDALRYSFDDVRMPYTSVGLTLGAVNTTPGLLGLNYHPRIKLGYFDARQGHETTVDIQLPFTRHIDTSLSLSLAVNANLAWTTIGNTAESNHILQLAPALSYREGGFSGKLGLYPTIGKQGPVQILPDLAMAYQFQDLGLGLAAGWQKQRVQNTLQQLTRVNPFATPDSSSRIQTLRNEVFATATLALGRHFQVWARGAWQRASQLPLFIPQAGGDGKDFTIVYEPRVDAIVWGGGVRYAIGQDFSVDAEGSWYNFYNYSSSRVWGEPAVRLKGGFQWRILTDLQLRVYTEIQDRIWSRTPVGQEIQQKGVFDFGASGEYSFVNRFGAFIRADNLLGRRNERWLGYPSFGFNLYGGLRFRF